MSIRARGSSIEIKLKGVIALMRKLLAGLYHVARAETFDSSRLFDKRRLQLAAPA